MSEERRAYGYKVDRAKKVVEALNWRERPLRALCFIDLEIFITESQ
jgi:hypothetical protein